MSKSKNCTNCEAEDVNFAINIGLCDACIGEKLEELQNKLDKHRWIPVSEGLPENMNTVLVIESGNNPKQGYYNSNQFYIWANAWCLTSNVTHWKEVVFPDGE